MRLPGCYLEEGNVSLTQFGDEGTGTNVGLCCYRCTESTPLSVSAIPGEERHRHPPAL